MAINQLGKIVQKETDSGTFDSGDLSPSDSNEGLIATFKANTAWQDGQAKYVKPSASTDQFAGVILNVSGTSLSSTTQPTLDPHGTSPGGNTVTVGTRGNYLLKTNAAVEAGWEGRAVIPNATVPGRVDAVATPGANTVVGRVIASNPNTNNLILVRLS